MGIFLQLGLYSHLHLRAGASVLHPCSLLRVIILPVRRSVNHGNISYHPHVIKGTGRHP